MAALTAPLTRRDNDSPISVITKPLPCFNNYQGTIDTQTFLGHVAALAAMLPSCRHAVNLCENRYLFTVTLAAVILRGQTNLLPPNKNIATQQGLVERYDDCYLIHDGIEVADKVNVFDLRTTTLKADSNNNENPEIPLDHLALISFTSGSTGQSKPNLKNWYNLTQGADINGRYMLGQQYAQGQMVATVPGQHMWGLETSILLALRYNLCVSNARPLYPKDIQIALNAISTPRMLVSTPVHLRAMAMSGLRFPKVERILCATAPLDRGMATQIEQCFDGEMMECYGCSEVGTMAHRRTINEDRWQLFDKISLVPKDDFTHAEAEHVPESVQMQDIITLHGGGVFSLNGRQSDLIEIAGKRGSLKEFNDLLLTVKGLIDGVVFMPESKGRTVSRLAAMVVLEDGVPTSRVADKFKQHLDSAFVPRIILPIAALPREDNGKLPHKNILQYYQSLTK